MYICHFLTRLTVYDGVYVRSPVSVCVCLYVSLCYICASVAYLSTYFPIAFSSESVHVTKGRQKTAKESLIPQGLNSLFDVAFLTL